MPKPTKTSYETRTIELQPLDVLFFRGGRPFDATARATSGLPMPQTVAGALRTWLFRQAGGDLDALAADIRRGASFAAAAAAQGSGPAAVGRIGVRGPWFARDGQRLVPMPANIESDADGRLYRYDPLAADLPGCSLPAGGMRPLWRRGPGPTKPRSGYLSASDGLRRFLAGGVPRPEEVVESDDLFTHEDRVGIAVNPLTGTVGDGMMYGVRMMRLRPDVTLSVDLFGQRNDPLCFPDDDAVLALGGEGRRAVVRRSGTWRWPAPPDSPGDGKLFLLTSPAPLGGWRPPEFAPLAAAVPGYVPVSGWDLARGGPKPNRFAVPAGSVYFGRDTAIPARNGSLCATDDASVGWGAYLEGVWKHA